MTFFFCYLFLFDLAGNTFPFSPHLFFSHNKEKKSIYMKGVLSSQSKSTVSRKKFLRLVSNTIYKVCFLMQSNFIIFPNSFSVYFFLQNLLYNVSYHVSLHHGNKYNCILASTVLSLSFCFCLSWELQSSLVADSAT